MPVNENRGQKVERGIINGKQAAAALVDPFMNNME